jgi:hypothetical protein
MPSARGRSDGKRRRPLLAMRTMAHLPMGELAASRSAELPGLRLGLLLVA